MARRESRPPTLPCIPDVGLLDVEKSPLLPADFDDVLSTTGCDGSIIPDQDSSSVHCSGSTSSSSSSGSSTLHPGSVLLPSPSRSISLDLGCDPRASYAVPRLIHYPNQEQRGRKRRRKRKLTPVPCRQLPATTATVFESWTITYHHPTQRTASWYRCLGVTCWHRVDREAGYVVSVVPNPHFSQAELAATVAQHQQALAAPTTTTTTTTTTTSSKDGGSSRSSKDAALAPAALAHYAADLERRLRSLDWAVQDEVYELLGDRAQSSSSAFRRREWRVAVLAAVPGGEVTDALLVPAGGCGGTSGSSSRTGSRSPALGFGFSGIRRRVGAAWRRAKDRRWRSRAAAAAVGRRFRAEPRLPITEYRLILRGTETKVNEQGWGSYNRYSRPWKAADEKEAGEGEDKRKWSGMSWASEKYVDF